MKSFAPKVKGFELRQIFGVPFFNKVTVQCRL